MLKKELKRHRIWSLITVILFVVCNIFFFLFYLEEKDRIIEDLNSRQMIHARQAAKGIEDYVESWITKLLMIARNESVIKLSPDGKKYIDSFYIGQSGHINSLLRGNEKGIIIYAPPSLNITGKDLSKQEHVIEIIKTKKPVVSDIFRAVQGYDAISITVPVFDNGKFSGTIGAIINVEEAGRRFLEDIKIGQTGYAWMISKGGTELYCPVPDHTGKTIYQTSSEFPSVIRMAEQMMQGKEGCTEYTYDQVRQNKVITVKKYAVYLPVKIHNTYWSIVVASTEGEVLDSLRSFRNKLYVLIIVLFIAGTLFAYFGMKSWGIIRESSARKEAQLQLEKLNSELELKVNQRTASLQAMNQELENFNYTISHDLRAPLRSINSFSQILSEEYSDILNSEGKELIERILRAGSKINLLIDSMMKLSRISYHIMDYSEVKISVLARTTVRDILTQYPNLNCDVNIQDKMEANGDYSLVTQLLECLFDNAVKFSSKKEKAVINFYTTELDGKTFFCLKDNGTGFSGANDSKLFSPFKRYHSDYEFTGIGIGLAIAKKIVDKHNGIIKAESAPGEGTAFYFTLGGCS